MPFFPTPTRSSPPKSKDIFASAPGVPTQADFTSFATGLTVTKQGTPPITNGSVFSALFGSRLSSLA